jgi:hypothetical protein
MPWYGFLFMENLYFFYLSIIPFSPVKKYKKTSEKPRVFHSFPQENRPAQNAQKILRKNRKTLIFFLIAAKTKPSHAMVFPLKYVV